MPLDDKFSVNEAEIYKILVQMQKDLDAERERQDKNSRAQSAVASFTNLNSSGIVRGGKDIDAYYGHGFVASPSSPVPPLPPPREPPPVVRPYCSECRSNLVSSAPGSTRCFQCIARVREPKVEPKKPEEWKKDRFELIELD